LPQKPDRFRPNDLGDLRDDFLVPGHPGHPGHPRLRIQQSEASHIVRRKLVQSPLK
jgi:hypothetical protein